MASIDIKVPNGGWMEIGAAKMNLKGLFVIGLFIILLVISILLFLTFNNNLQSLEWSGYSLKATWIVPPPVVGRILPRKMMMSLPT